MAMLAERKRKIKWSLNPRGNDWANDENKFGQRMLEKMGWEPGTGLGAKRQGRTDFIRIQIKTDTKGLGNKDKYDEVWTQQQQSFDSLLAELNGVNGEAIDKDPTSIPSLEEKSRKSRSRVHYHKFTRGKDVSKYSSKDLSGIIGIGGKQSEESSEEPKETTNSMYDYFKKKSQKMYLNNEESYETQQPYSFNEETASNEEFEGANNDEKKKLKKKDKRKSYENEENICDNQYLEPNDIPLKKRKKKKIVGDEETNENESESYNIDDFHEDLTTVEDGFNLDNEIKASKKKKKKRHKDMENSL